MIKWTSLHARHIYAQMQYIRPYSYVYSCSIRNYANIMILDIIAQLLLMRLRSVYKTVLWHNAKLVILLVASISSSKTYLVHFVHLKVLIFVSRLWCETAFSYYVISVLFEMKEIVFPLPSTKLTSPLSSLSQLIYPHRELSRDTLVQGNSANLLL